MDRRGQRQLGEPVLLRVAAAHPPRFAPAPHPSAGGTPLTAGGGLGGPLLAAAAEAALHGHVEVGEHHEGEGDVEAAAVLLHQKVPLELPDLVVVLLHGAHGVAAGASGGQGQARASPRPPVVPPPMPRWGF